MTKSFVVVSHKNKSQDTSGTHFLEIKEGGKLVPLEGEKRASLSYEEATIGMFDVKKGKCAA
jgi:hypothetical protein